MQVTTAIILAAGFGSRMLPVTAAVEKSLLPILNRPIIDYVVTDCVNAGIKRIIFVVAKGSHGIKDLYLGNPTLERYLVRYHKTAALEKLRAVQEQVSFEFVEQAEGAYGTAIPVQAALPLLKPGENAFVSDGDTFCWHPDGSSDVRPLIELTVQHQAAGGAMGMERPEAELSRWGVFDIQTKKGTEYLRGLVEKPAPGTAPSNVMNLTKFILTPALHPYVKNVSMNPASGEYYLTDAFDAAAKDLPIVVHRAQGKLLDAGTVEGWLEANLTVANSYSELAPTLQAFRTTAQ
jgi:UTP--glucose-1-phosphate uridylyltransferase